MANLIDIDQAWLLAINGCRSDWADMLLWYVSQSWVWIPLYAFMIGLLLWTYGWKKALLITVLLVAAAGISDWISSGCIKPLVARWRPTHEPALAGLVQVIHGYAGGRFGFVSSHAANTLSVALLFSLIWRRTPMTILMLTWVALNCYSRMYLGVHYPGDIVGGCLVGVVVALLIYRLIYKKWIA